MLKKDSNELRIVKSGKFDIFMCQFTTIELFKHKEKVIELSKLNFDDILSIYQVILNSVTVINEKDIPKNILLESKEICREIDINDTIFIAVSKFIDSYLWTGDKKLIKGLPRKGFDKFFTTNQLLPLIG